MPSYYRLLCGNYDCPTRYELDGEPRLFRVEPSEMVDGDIWLCPTCAAAVTDANPAS